MDPVRIGSRPLQSPHYLWRAVLCRALKEYMTVNYKNKAVSAFHPGHERPEQPMKIRRSPTLSRRELRRIVADMIG
jgi:hypothetical protein